MNYTGTGAAATGITGAGVLAATAGSPWFWVAVAVVGITSIVVVIYGIRRRRHERRQATGE